MMSVKYGQHLEWMMHRLRMLLLPTCLLLVLLAPAPAAWAQTEAIPAPDQVRIEQLTFGPPPAGAQHSLRFEAQVQYELRSAPRAFLLVFLFEDNAQASSQAVSRAVWVDQGAGRATLTIDSSPGQDVQSLTLIVGMFEDRSSLLNWTSTTPFSVYPLQARVALENAMASRVGGDHVAAVEHLSRALSFAPQAASLYYWRGDSLIHLGLYPEAVADYTTALQYLPNDRASRAARGIAYLWQEEWHLAVEDLTVAIEQSETVDRWALGALKARGVAHAALNLLDEAVADYEAYLAQAVDAPDRAEVAAWIEQLNALRGAGQLPPQG